MKTERDKIILYLDKTKRVFIAYDKPEDKDVLMESVAVVYNKIDIYKDSFKERWVLKEIKETKSTSNELTVTMKFKLNIRKLE